MTTEKQQRNAEAVSITTTCRTKGYKNNEDLEVTCEAGLRSENCWTVMMSSYKPTEPNFMYVSVDDDYVLS